MVKEMKLEGTKSFSPTAEEIKWSAKMQRAFAEKEFYVGDINNFWRE